MKYDALQNLSTGRTGLETDSGYVGPCGMVKAGAVIELASDDVRVPVWKRNGAIKPHVKKEAPKDAPKGTGKVTKKGGRK